MSDGNALREISKRFLTRFLIYFVFKKSGLKFARDFSDAKAGSKKLNRCTMRLIANMDGKDHGGFYDAGRMTWV